VKFDDFRVSKRAVKWVNVHRYVPAAIREAAGDGVGQNEALSAHVVGLCTLNQVDP
jgi:hypothetical protein